VRIALLLLFAFSLFADTLIVDDDGQCDGAQYTTIQDAVDAAHDGDTIEICVGTYDEAVRVNQDFSSLIFAGGSDVAIPSDVNWKNDNAPLAIYTSMDVTIKNLSLSSSEKKGVYFKKIQNVTFQNVVVSSKDESIYIDADSNGEYSFFNCVIKSSDKKGIYIKRGKDVTVIDTTIDAKQSGLYGFKYLNGNYTIKNSKLKSRTKYGIYFNNGKDLTITSTIVEAKDRALYLGDNIDGNYEISNTKLISKDADAFYYENEESASKITILNSYLEAKKFGLEIDNFTALQVSDSTIFSEDTNINIKNAEKGKVIIYGCRLQSQKKDFIFIEDVTTLDMEGNLFLGGDDKGIDVKKVGTSLIIKNNIISKPGDFGLFIENGTDNLQAEIKRNIFKDAKKYGLNIEDSDAKSYEITRNCFLDNEYTAFNKNENAHFDLNFFDDWSGSGRYKIPDVPVYDEHPSPQCLQNIVFDFDEGEGNTTFDKAVGDEIADDGTLHDAQWSAGVCGKGVYLDGTKDSHIEVAKSEENRLDKSPQMSVVVWIKPDGSQNGRAILFNKENQYEVALEGRRLWWALNTTQKRWLWYRTNLEVEPDNWHMIAFVYDGEKVTLYLDGLEASQSFSYRGILIGNASTLRIGARGNNASPTFKGWVDEFYLYQRALNPEEIQDLYENGIYCQPVGDWHFDTCRWVGYDGEARDSSPQKNHGTPKNGAQTTVGKLCRGAGFDGVDDYILLPAMDYRFSSGMTVATWAKFDRDESGSWEKIIDFGGGRRADNIEFARYEETNDLAFEVLNDDQVCGTIRAKDAIIPGEWHHYAVTYSKDGTVKIYRDGQKIGSGKLSNCLLRDVKRDHNYIGQSNWEEDAYFKGGLDELHIFRRALSTSKIKEIYDNENSGKNWDGTQRHCRVCGMTIYYPMNEKEGDKVFDQASHDAIEDTGILHSGASRTRGVCQGGVYLDGGDEAYISTKDSVENSLPDATQMSVVIWVKPDPDISGAAIVFNKENEYEMAVDGKKIKWAMKTSDERWVWYRTNLEVEPGSWHMIAFVYTGREVRVYLDGKDNVWSKEYSGVLQATSYELRIGKRTQGSNPPFKGFVDEFRLYDRLLMPDEVEALYRQGLGCEHHITGVFDVVDKVDGSCDAEEHWDDPLTTKVVVQPFAVTILAKGKETNRSIEANITKVELRIYDEQCAQLQDSITLCENGECGNTDSHGCLHKENIQIDRAYRCARFFVEGKEVNASETNSSLSQDTFAMRPKGFVITSLNNVIAGEDFNLTLLAKDDSEDNAKEYNETLHLQEHSPVLEYNETKSICMRGELEKVSGGEFEDGEANVTLRYSEVGKIELTLREINGSEYAKIDADDTPLSQRLITPATQTITIVPHHFKIEGNLSDFEKNFTYLSQDLNMSAKIELNITAQNRQNETTANYNTECYANDINITLSHTPVTSSNLEHLLYILRDAREVDETNKSIGKNENLFIEKYSASNFTTEHNGSTHLTLFFNFDRRASEPVEPFKFSVEEINVTDSEANGTTQDIDGEASFYYARLKSNDLSTDKTEDNVTLPILVYHSDRDGAEILEGWKEMRDHQDKDGNITQLLAKKGFALGDPDSSITATAALISGSGYYQVQIDNPSKEQQAYIHLDIPSWLWYTYDASKNYAYDPSSDCSHHPCIQYRFFKSLAKQIKSGSITGVDFEQNISRNKRGVRILR